LRVDFGKLRAELVRSLRSEIGDERVLEVMGRIPRELFVPPEHRRRAYVDGPLPIGQGQTISQPLIVALMTQELELSGKEKVLEVGTGSGYQTAILASLSHFVVTTEKIPELLERAKEVLGKLGFRNIEFHLAKDSLGWEEGAPYDAILVTCGSPQIPPPLLGQLKEGGRMVIPVGGHFEQDLLKVVKGGEGNRVSYLCPCRFVPLIGEGGWEG
jgi:protein-L-isoaspartate(D-aspartate) O-methyltransferase